MRAANECSYVHEDGWRVDGSPDAIHQLEIKMTRLLVFESVFPDCRIMPTPDQKLRISYNLPSELDFPE